MPNTFTDSKLDAALLKTQNVYDLYGGVVDYLKKPVKEEEILGSVRRALAAKGLALLSEEELHRSIGASIRDLRKKRALTLK